ncbi:nitronate monooxygenase [Clostridiales bacterium PH28_bin88]|nr:nitronate monooxygenase [Clostridiales bacterium PH28_bin88]
MKTKITELFGINYPIILGGLQWLGRAELAAAVSNAGGLGLITAGSFANKEEFLKEVDTIRTLTGKPFGVNISLGTRRDMTPFFEGAIEAGVEVVFTSGRNPEGHVEGLKAAGTKVVHVVSSVRHAVKAVELGVDAVVAVSFEAGGHPGMDDVGGIALIPRVVDSVPVPVIAAGGIADSRGLMAALALGAEGVQLGTLFMATEECIAHSRVKEALISTKETDTIMIERPWRNARRVLRTPTSEKVLEMENQGAKIDDVLPLIGGQAYIEVMSAGNLDKGVLTLGQGVGLIQRITTVAEAMEEMVRGAEQVLARLSQVYGGADRQC